MLEADLEEAVSDSREKEQRLRDEIRGAPCVSTEPECDTAVGSDLSTELTITKAKLTPRPGVPVLPLNGLSSPATPIPSTPGETRLPHACTLTCSVQAQLRHHHSRPGAWL